MPMPAGARYCETRGLARASAWRPGLEIRHRRGTILIVTMFVVFTLASLVLVLAGSMRVEAMSSANLTASIQSASIERGAEQYVLSMLTEQKDQISTLTDDYFAAVQVGDGYFWIMRPNYGDTSLPLVGLTEEAAKLNINNATYSSLMMLPNMTDDVAQAILDWHAATTSTGASDSYYAGLPDPYTSKKAAFETVEEVLLVQGATRQLLYGDGTPVPLGPMPMGSPSNFSSASSQQAADLATARGIYDLLTVCSSEAGGAAKVNVNDPNQRTNLLNVLGQQLGDVNRAAAIVSSIGRTTFIDAFDFSFQMHLTQDELSKVYDSITAGPVAVAAPARASALGGVTGSTGTAPIKGRINVNTAPRDVLLCLPGLAEADVDNLISARQGSAAGSTSVAWVAQTLGQKAVGLGSSITGTTNQYSADILAVTGDGRSFKRCRIVINATGTTPTIIYRRDLTDRGWPMDPQLLASLRSGQGPGAWAGTGTSGTTSGGLTR
jgi:type II secretory pathway component PulK